MEQLKLALESSIFELAYERTSRQVEVVCDAERYRQLRVRALLLEDDRDDLHTQSTRAHNHIDGLTRSNERLQEDLEVCTENCESAQEQLRIRSREIDTMKAELKSLHGVTMDSTKLLTEKLTLARELSALKPEIDHLRSQSASHQSLLAEKLSLQRQLGTVQIELTTEKRATQRALAKEEKIQAVDAKLESRLESLQADLVRERRERQTVEREARKDSTESGNRITTLESRLDAFRNKLKSTKEQLKEAKTSLQAAQPSDHSRLSRASASTNPATMGNPCKRGAMQMDADTILGTPGGLPVAKKSKRGSALIGEKSTFSITPFLNRTTGVARESPLPDNAGEADEMNKVGSDQLSGVTSQKKTSKGISDLAEMSHTLTNVVQANKPGMLRDVTVGVINSRAPPARKNKAPATLEQVAEEDIDNTGSDTNISRPAVVKDSFNDTVHGSFEMKKRKRKLLGGALGKTLFDEDEGDALKDFRVPDIRSRKAMDTNVTTVSTFGAISPLKKNKVRI